MFQNIPSNSANVIAPFNPLGRATVGLENSEDKPENIFKPVEQGEETAASANERDPDNRINNPAEQQRLAQGLAGASSEESVAGSSAINAGGVESDSVGQTTPNEGDPEQVQAAEAEQQSREDELVRQQEAADQAIIQQLAARDREVRAHEQAHSAVGGQYAGSPSYTFERGPDGVNYAVGGEVSISAGKVAGDPEATIEKAQVVRRAALAPAEPSAQDRRVASEATRLEVEARNDLQELQREERIEAETTRQEARAEREQEAEKAREEREAREADQQESLAQASEQASAAFSGSAELNAQLVNLGAYRPPTDVGSLVNQQV